MRETAQRDVAQSNAHENVFTQMPSRQPSPNYHDIALVGIGSRFPSRAASPDLHGISLRGISGDDDVQDHDHANGERMGLLAVSREVPAELHQEVSTSPSDSFRAATYIL